jgi:NADPH:quinone reductase-like Zn-dependent oxidoreductase
MSSKLVEIGEKVKQFQFGDDVYTMLPRLNAGDYAEYVVAKAADIAYAPKNLSLSKAAANCMSLSLTVFGIAITGNGGAC